MHLDGEVYGAIGWRLLEHYQAAGIDKSVLLADLVDGMNYTPGEPTYEEMRDGILAGLARLRQRRARPAWSGTRSPSTAWASGPRRRQGQAAITVESFDLPADCQE